MDKNTTVKILDTLWRFIKHPVTCLVIGCILTIITFLASKSEKEPVYVISPFELLAQTMDEENSLKISWNGQEIKNVNSVKIALWNNGSQLIDKKDILVNNPIRLVSLSNVDILSVQTICTSRPELKFTTLIEKDEGNNESIVLKVEGDEVLEKLDGILLRILYSGSPDCVWTVTGRIKGNPEGFKKVGWNYIMQYKNKIYIFNILYLLSIIPTFIILKKLTKDSKSVILILLGLVFITSLLTGSAETFINYFSINVPLWLLNLL